MPEFYYRRRLCLRSLVTARCGNIVCRIKYFGRDVIETCRRGCSAYIRRSTHYRLPEQPAQRGAPLLGCNAHGGAAVFGKQFGRKTVGSVIHNGYRAHTRLNQLKSHFGHIVYPTLQLRHTAQQGYQRLGVCPALYFKYLPHSGAVCGIAPDTPHSICRIYYHAALTERVNCCLNVFTVNHCIAKISKNIHTSCHCRNYMCLPPPPGRGAPSESIYNCTLDRQPKLLYKRRARMVIKAMLLNLPPIFMVGAFIYQKESLFLHL